MTEADVREALAPAGMEYVQQASSYPELQYLVAAKADESYAFTFLDGRVVAYSIVHILPAANQPAVKTAGGDADPVSSVSLQVLNMKAMTAFAAKHSQPLR